MQSGASLVTIAVQWTRTLNGFLPLAKCFICSSLISELLGQCYRHGATPVTRVAGGAALPYILKSEI